MAPDRTLIGEELRDMRKREKRQHLITTKGMAATGPGDAASQFNQLTQTQFRFTGDLALIRQILSHSAMFLPKVMSDEQHKMVLNGAKK